MAAALVFDSATEDSKWEDDLKVDVSLGAMPVGSAMHPSFTKLKGFVFACTCQSRKRHRKEFVAKKLEVYENLPHPTHK